MHIPIARPLTHADVPPMPSGVSATTRPARPRDAQGPSAPATLTPGWQKTSIVAL